tara:strand:- start:748 stop:990 length:243 start_codon:yes stop_codon:yes gene_type:complete
MYSQMTKTVSIGSSGVPTASFTETITDATKGEFKIALAKATTIPIKSGRYEYDIIMGVGSSLYSVARGNINVFTGISTDT